jgi:hypothetical protein
VASRDTRLETTLEQSTDTTLGLARLPTFPEEAKNCVDLWNRNIKAISWHRLAWPSLIFHPINGRVYWESAWSPILAVDFPNYSRER